MEAFDVLVIGGGPGGYVAAIRAAQLGKKVGLIEANHLGGICLNWGCIPTKALLRSAELLEQIKHASEFGIQVAEVKPDLDAMVARSRAISDKLSQGIGYLLKKNHISCIEGFARFASANEVMVGDKSYHGEHIIIATGARARELPHLPIDGKRVWSYRQALVPKAIPKRLLIVGSGAIGIEFANFYQALGAEVCVIEMAPQVLPAEDAEIAAIAQKAMEKQGISFELNAKVTSLNHDVATIERNDESFELGFDVLISAVGVVPNVEDLGLDAAAIELDPQGFILTDELGRTTANHIFAIGDVSGAPCLAHKASHEGIIAAEAICGLPVHGLDKDNIPACTYGFVQVASIGQTEAQLKAQGRAINIGRFNLAANGKAIAMGDAQGMVKVIFCETTGELLGAHMVGAEVTEMVQGFAIGKTLETTEEQLMETIFPHPTMSEAMHEAVLDAYQRAIHH